MPKPAISVVKLGGSLLRDACLREWLDACRNDAADGEYRVVVGGGGLFADGVRALDRRWHLDEAAAHALAMDGMAMTARLLAHLAGNALMFSEPARGALPWATGGVCVWLPARPYAVLGLPASWDVTSDSIALRLAEKLGAQRLVLVKSLNRKEFPDHTPRMDAKPDVVDRAFRGLAADSPVPVRVLARDEVGALSDGADR